MGPALADQRHAFSRLQLNLRSNYLGPDGAKALAPALVCTSLTRADVCDNKLDNAAKEQLRVSVRGREGLELLL